MFIDAIQYLNLYIFFNIACINIYTRANDSPDSEDIQKYIYFKKWVSISDKTLFLSCSKISIFWISKFLNLYFRIFEFSIFKISIFKILDFHIFDFQNFVFHIFDFQNFYFQKKSRVKKKSQISTKNNFRQTFFIIFLFPYEKYFWPGFQRKYDLSTPSPLKQNFVTMWMDSLNIISLTCWIQNWNVHWCDTIFKPLYIL